MSKTTLTGSKKILLLFICLAGPLCLSAGQPGEDFIKPEGMPPILALEFKNPRELSNRVILVPSEGTPDRVTAVMEIRSPKIVVEDLLAIRGARNIQNKYLKRGMWISIPVDPENPGNKKHTVKMLFTNIDIYVDGGAGKRRLPFEIRDRFVLASYNEKGLTPPGPVLVRFDVSGLETYAAEVKEKYLNPHLSEDPNYSEIPGFYYLVPRKDLDWRAIKAEAARARRPRSFEDYVIDGTLFGTWYPMERLEDTKEAGLTRTETGAYLLEVHSWPSDDRSYVGF